MTKGRLHTVIKKLIYAHGRTILEVANESEISYTTMRNFCSGRTSIKSDSLERILKTVGVDINQIVTHQLPRENPMSVLPSGTTPVE